MAYFPFSYFQGERSLPLSPEGWGLRGCREEPSHPEPRWTPVCRKQCERADGQRIPVNLRSGRLLCSELQSWASCSHRRDVAGSSLPYTLQKPSRQPPAQAHFLWPFVSEGPAVCYRLPGVTRARIHSSYRPHWVWVWWLPGKSAPPHGGISLNGHLSGTTSLGQPHWR